MLKKVSSLTHAIGAICLALVFTAVFMNIVIRMMGMSLGGWVEELSGYAVVWSTYLGMAHTFRQNVHVRVDLISEKLSRRNRALLRALADIACVAFGGVIIVYGFYLVKVAYISERITPLAQLPIYVLMVVMPVGMTLFTLEALADAFNSVRSAITNNPRSSQTGEQSADMMERDTIY